MPEDNRSERWWWHLLEGVGEVVSLFAELLGAVFSILLELLSGL